MAENVTDSSEVEIPGKSDVAERGETNAGRKSGRWVGKAALVGGSLMVLIYAGTFGLGSEEVVEDEKASNAATVDMAQTRHDDPANTDGLGLPDEELVVVDESSGEGERGSDTKRLRAERLAAREAERQRLIALRESRERAPVMVLNSTGRATSAMRATSQRVSGSDAIEQTSAPSGNETLTSRLNASEIVRVNASRLPNRNFSIEAGSQIPCTLQTALDSTLSGLVSCVIPYDVRSATGQVVLLEKGTRVLGEYQGGIQQGEARIFVIWNRAVSPNGVAVNLASPSADALGRSGQTGEVENFFFKRFGGALLLSLIGDASSALSNSISGVEQSFNTPNQAASDALRNDINIRPVLRAPQGSSLVVMVARDLDFSDVYSLRLRR